MRKLFAVATMIVVVGCTTNSATISDAAPPSAAPAGPDGASNSSASVPCDPLAPAATMLGTILGVGKDAANTLYAADTGADGQNRVFISSANTLVRQFILGSGQMGGGAGAQYTFSFESRDSDGADARALLVNLQGGTASAMALGPANSRSFLDDAAVGDTPLTLVDTSVVFGFAILNLPGTVQYVGDVENGDVLVVTAPMQPYSSAGFRIFYGAASDEREGTITNFSQAFSGYPEITFIIGATTYMMVISTLLPADGSPLGEPGPGTLSIAGGPSFGFTLRRPTPKVLSGFSFACLAP
jgi:hypothetical protein